MSILPNFVTFYPEENLSEDGFRANSYYIDTGDCQVLIDPSLREEIDPQLLILTHAHYDHIIELPYWHDQCQLPLYCPKRDDYLLSDPQANCSQMFGKDRTYSAADHYYDDRETIELGKNYVLWTLNTPGHTHGSSCLFLFRKADRKPFSAAIEQGQLISNGKLELIISGDTIFDDCVGRVDLVTGDVREMKQTLTMLDGILRRLDPEIPILPGHGDVCTLRYLLQHNLYLRAR